MADADQAGRAKALIARVEAETRDQLDRIRAEADTEAAAVVRAARARARERVRREVAALRRQHGEAMRKETARLDTARRYLRQRESAAVLEAGLPALREALSALWADDDGRRAWTAALVDAAVARLFPGRWVVEHPAGWSDAERDAIAEDLAKRSGEVPKFRTDPELGAGLRLCQGEVCLDGSAAALLRNPDEVGAALLAELAGLEERT